MKITRYIRGESESLDDILRRLDGKVFHVAKAEYCASIRKNGEITTNVDGTLPSTFGSSAQSYFRKRGCVSLFDYRSVPTNDIEFHRSKCHPFAPARDCGAGIGIFMLSSEAWGSLIPWTQARADGKSCEMVVPYFEAGYPGPITIDLVEEIIFLKLEEDPNSLPAKLRAAHNAAR